MSNRNLYKLAEQEGIVILTWDFVPPADGIYYYECGIPPIIGIANRIQEDSVLYRCVLAEELGHHFTTTKNALPPKYQNIREKIKVGRAEFQARRWAAQYLMPLDRVIESLQGGTCQSWELAQEFGVTEELVNLRMELPDIKQWLNREQAENQE